jgi:hypothetical protein
VTVWEDLRPVLLELQNTGVLMSYPTPNEERSDQPPFHVGLASWATDTAADLHRRFGDGVELRVGVLGYPDPWAAPVRSIEAKAPLDPAEAVVELDGPGVVRSGDFLRTGLLLTNVSDHDLTVNTNGQLTALVLDPRTSDVVGGFSGAQTLPSVRFDLRPGDRTTIPLLVGTTSFVPDLGYRLPEGAWEMAADLRFADGRVLRSGSVPLAITAR